MVNYFGNEDFDTPFSNSSRRRQAIAAMANSFDNGDESLFQTRLSSPNSLPPLPPAQMKGYLQNAMDSAMGGLEWVGDSLDKFTGARTVRGLAGGQGLSAFKHLVPDAIMGKENQPENITGKKLNEQYLGIKDNPNSWWDDVAGFGTEVALDPGLFLSPLGKTAKGLTAAKSGTAAKGIGEGIKAGERALVTASIPFTGKSIGIGTGKTAQRFGDMLDGAYDFAKFRNPVGRTFNQLFDARAKGAGSEAVQWDLVNNVAPQLEQDRFKVRSTLQPLARKAQEGGIVDSPEAQRQMRRYLEDINSRRDIELSMQTGLIPQDQHAAVKAGLDLADELKGVLPQVADTESLRRAGIRLEDLTDPFAEYFPRYHHSQGPRGFFGQMQEAFQKQVPQVLNGRKNFLKGIPEGTDAVEKMIADPLLSGWNRHEAWAAQGVTGSRRALQKQVNERIASTHFGTSMANAKPELKSQIKRIGKWLGQLDPKYAGGEAFFNADPVTDLMRRADNQLNSLSSANSATRVLADVAQPMANGADPRKFVPLKKALGQAGLGFEGVDAAGNPIGAIENVTRELAGRGKGAAIADYFVPADVVDDLVRAKSAGEVPEALNPLVKGYDATTNAFRSHNTVLFPAFFSRNAFNGLYNNAVAGAGDPTTLLQTWRALSGGDLSPDFAKKLAAVGINSKEALLDEMKAAGGAFGQNVIDEIGGGRIASAVPTTGSLAKRIGNAWSDNAADVAKRAAAGQYAGKLGAFGRLVDKYDQGAVEAGQAVGNYLEDVMRGSHYTARRLQGFNPVEAARSVKDWHFDYSPEAFTPFERKWIKGRTVPFYSFAKNNLPLMASQIVQRPGGAVAQTVRGLNTIGDPGVAPSNVTDQNLMRWSENPDGSTTFFNLAELFPQSESFGRFSSGPEGARKTGFKHLAMTNPIPKGLAEKFFGVSFFKGGEELGDLHSRTGVPMLDWLLSMTPLSRATTTFAPPTDAILNTVTGGAAGKPWGEHEQGGFMFDPRKTAAQKLANLLSGAKFNTIDEEDMRKGILATARQRVEDMLQGTNGIGSFDKIFVRPGEAKNLTPDQRQWMRFYNSLGGKRTPTWLTE